MSRPIGLTWRAWLWVQRVEWRRRFVSFGNLVDWLEARPVAASPSAPPEECLAAVRRAYRLSPFHASCLKESLAGIGLLRSLGYPARLAIGVREWAGPVQAHAWVEIEGETLGSRRDGYLRMRREEFAAFGADGALENSSSRARPAPASPAAPSPTERR